MKRLDKIIKIVTSILLVVFSFVVLVLTARGFIGSPNPELINKNLIKESSPFEGSSSTARYALTMSMVNNNSLQLNRDLALISTPDLAMSNGNYVSLFAPGVSIAAVPFFKIGKLIGNEQLATYSMTTIFATLNFVLIAFIVNKLTKNYFAGITAGIIFTFATVAWPYSSTLTQHHPTVFIMLSAIALLIKVPGKLGLLLTGILYSTSLLFDYPNGLIMLPVMLLAITRTIDLDQSGSKLIFTFKAKVLFLGIGLALGIIPTLFYNHYAHNDFKQITATLPRVVDVDNNTEERRITSDKTVSGFFKLSKVPQGMDVLIGSQDRGIIFFAPIIIFGLLGISSMVRLNSGVGITLAATTVLSIALYSSWGDPWGGWSFGPRYLIPTMAILSLFLGSAIHKYGRNWLFSLLFLPVAVYSVFINLTGALTTTRIPPSVEEAFSAWPKPIILYGLKLVQENRIGSFVYNQYLSSFMTAQIFGIILFASIVLMLLVSYILAVISQKGTNEN